MCIRDSGKSTSSTTVDYSFTYRADTPGTYVIGEARITAGGKTYTTKPVSFTVLPPDKAAQSGQGARVDDISSQSPDKTVSANDVFVRIILNLSLIHISYCLSYANFSTSPRRARAPT